MIKVDKDIPIPKVRYDRHVFPFDQLQLGDSFFVPNDHPSFHSVRSLATINKTHERAYTCRRCEGGVRVWRVV